MAINSHVGAHQAKSSPFPGSLFPNNTTQMNPITWWKAIKKCGVSQSFVQYTGQLPFAPSIFFIYRAYFLQLWQ